jgi:hypothetical protein
MKTVTVMISVRFQSCSSVRPELVEGSWLGSV